MREFPFIHPDKIERRRGNQLPHWTAENAIYHVVYRLADSLPRPYLEALRQERESLLRQSERNPGDHIRLAQLMSGRTEKYLDLGGGSCLLRSAEAASLVKQSISFFHGERYELHAWCVMPNHVHLVIQPLPGFALSTVMHSLKSFTAHELNRLLDRRGQLWHPEYYDHMIRHEAAYSRVVNYVLANPTKANLRNWEFVGQK